MASVASASLGASPVSPYDFEFPPASGATDPPGGDLDDDAFWSVISSAAAGGTSVGTGPGSVGLISSPSAHSLGSPWAVLGHRASGQQHLEQLELSPAALSPGLGGEIDQHSGFGHRSSFDQQGGSVGGDGFSATAADGNWSFAQFLAQDLQDYSGALLGAPYNGDLTGLFNTPGDAQLPLGESLALANMPPWEPLSNLRGTNNFGNDRPTNADSNSGTIFIMEDPNLIAPSPPSSHLYSPPTHSASPASAHSPRSPVPIKQEPSSTSSNRSSSSPEHSKPSPPTATAHPTTTAAIPIRKANTSNRVQKRKPQTSASLSASSVAAAVSTSPTTSADSSSSSPSPPGAAAAAASKFHILTPDSISRQMDKPNRFECFEAHRPSQRGRKGPLATDTKQSALQVRRMGACFSCHARKVKCDKERPCRSCVRLAQQVPQVVCWQFSDFTAVLFPEFIRGHLRKEAVARFLSEHVERFIHDKPCTVEMYSGYGFSARLVVPARFFTAKTVAALQHWHLHGGVNQVELQATSAAPIGLDGGQAQNAEGGGAGGSGGGEGQRNEMRKRLREYVQAIVGERDFAALVTPLPQHTLLPRKLLKIVHDYANRSDLAMVKRALTIYTMHYVMTKHLVLTDRCVAELGPTGLVPQGVPFVTARVLNRQLKAVLDEMLCQEVQKLFENFSKSLKPKLRSEWAPCLASFLVMCLIMESIEVAADSHVMTENEISLRRYLPPRWKRSFALQVNSEIENMPFKQFAFQFHQIYQTHSRDAAARSFNPLLDDSCFEQAELDGPAEDMVRKLRRFIDADWSELDYLTADPILPNNEEHVYPRNVAYDYTGRLVAKFLLSFTDEKYIFGRKV